jgi:hypothetical protein
MIKSLFKGQLMNRAIVMLSIVSACLVIITSSIIPGNAGSTKKTTTKWGNMEPNMKPILSITPMPPSSGSIMTDKDKGARRDCQLITATHNNEGVAVTEWACWAIK